MRFEIDWQSDAANAAPEERSTVAALRVFLNDRNICECERPRRRQASWPANGSRVSLRRDDHVLVSVYPLAEEIVFNWWRLFGARDAEVRIVAGRGGYALPDLRFKFDGLGFEASCQALYYENPPVRFLAHEKEWSTREDAEAALADFIDQGVDRLRQTKVRDTGVQLRWQRIQASRQNAEESAFCEAAGALGVDAYQLSDENADFIERTAQWFADEPLLELLSGLRASASSGNSLPRPDVLAWVRQAESRPDSQSRLPTLEGLRTSLSTSDAQRKSERPWEKGYRCARAARQQLDISLSERFQEQSLAKRLDAPHFAAAGLVSGIRAVVETRNQEVHVHLRDANPRARLFALGRAVGDVVANLPAERSPINDLHEAARQATGRAFAAEFLAPIDEILSMQEDGKDVVAIADEFNVSEEVVERQLQNQERIAAAGA